MSTEITISAAECSDEIKLTGEINTGNNLQGEISACGDVLAITLPADAAEQTIVLQDGQVAVDTRGAKPLVKIGDGVTAWADLPYKEVTYIEA
ncbi:MAG: hypothetical protein DBY32_04125 [Phascolarctobacterium sp.]|nr:MAG: hypothetical protein DBY32_04125 [Phascolarctobacterium sp.]